MSLHSSRNVSIHRLSLSRDTSDWKCWLYSNIYSPFLLAADTLPPATHTPPNFSSWLLRIKITFSWPGTVSLWLHSGQWNVSTSGVWNSWEEFSLSCLYCGCLYISLSHPIDTWNIYCLHSPSAGKESEAQRGLVPYPRSHNPDGASIPTEEVCPLRTWISYFLSYKENKLVFWLLPSENWRGLWF